MHIYICIIEVFDMHTNFEEMGWKRQKCFLSLWLGLCTHFLLHAECSPKNHTRWTGWVYEHPETSQSSSLPVKLGIIDTHVVIDNGIVKITLHNPTGELTGIQYNGIDNLLESYKGELQRGYWDVTWSRQGHGRNTFDTLQATNFNVIAQDDDKVEVSFSKTWNPYADPNGLPLNYDKRFVLLRGSSGFYTYAIYEHLVGWPALTMGEGRIVFKLSENLFNFMAVSDDMQTIMPGTHDFESGKRLDYREGILLTNPENPALKGQVDDKYQYSMEHKDDLVHGWISSNSHTGFWVIIPSSEFRAGGPVKLELTSHSVSTCLVPFFTGHYAGRDMGVKIEQGQPWKKVFGPVFIYLNSDPFNNEPQTLWRDAKRQMLEEKGKWPYDFPLSLDYPHADQRGATTGRLMIQDRYISRAVFPANSAYVGLAPPGGVGSWQTESNGYQFWTRTDGNGYFNIKNVRPGTYNLYAWVPGILGDYKYNAEIQISPGSQHGLNDLTYYPPRNGPTLWEIGIPDRSAAEFFIPDPDPMLRNHLYSNHREKHRQYGLWNRYTDLYPNGDLVYTIGKSDFRNDWFFAHISRRVGEGSRTTFVPTTRQIRFHLDKVNIRGTYTLRIALASASYGIIQVRINHPNRIRPNFGTSHVGSDNAIARHGIHGLYWLYSFQVPGFELVEGANTMYIVQLSGGPFNGVMYDYIRLEGPGVNY